ncbi:unnamed protein product [Closterium sp. NIES-65]|nr:unnamed protein product [Closterium sp. NIES-65]
MARMTSLSRAPSLDVKRLAVVIAAPSLRAAAAAAAAAGGAPGAPSAGGAPGAPSAGGAPGAPSAGGAPGAPSAGGAPGAPSAGGAPGAPSAGGAPGAPSAGGAPGAPSAGGAPGAPSAGGAPGAPSAGGAPGAPSAGGAPGAPSAGGAPGAPSAGGAPEAPAALGAAPLGAAVGAALAAAVGVPAIRTASVLTSKTNMTAKFNVDVNITSTQQTALYTFTVMGVPSSPRPVFSKSSYRNNNTGQLVAEFTCTPKPTGTLGTYRCTSNTAANLTVPFRPVSRVKALVPLFFAPYDFYSRISVNGVTLRGDIISTIVIGESIVYVIKPGP